MKRWLIAIAALEGIAIVVLGILLLRPRETAGPPQPDGTRTAAMSASESGPTSALSPAPEVRSENPAATRSEAPAAAGTPAGILLFGTIGDEAGNAIEKVSLNIAPADEVSHSDVGVNGRSYAVPDLSAGRWKLQASASGFQALRETFDLAAAPAQVRKDIVLKRAPTVNVVFRTPSGESLATALEKLQSDDSRPIFPSAWVSREPPGGDLPLTSTSEVQSRDGSRYYGARGGYPHQRTYPPGCDGVIELGSNPPVYVSAVLRHHILDTKLVPPGSESVTLVVDPAALTARLASLKLRLVDAATRAPLPRAKVALNDRAMGGGGRLPDADGRIEFRNVRSGILSLEVNVPDYEWFQMLVRLEPGRTLDLGELALAAGITISGRIVDAEGQPVATLISAYNLDRMLFPQEFDQGSGGMTKADGTFTIPRLARGRYLLRSQVKKGVFGAVAVDTSAGPVADVVVRLEPVSRVFVEFGELSSAAPVLQIRDARDLLVASVRGRVERQALDLPRGSYRLDVFDDSGRIATQAFEVAAEPVTLKVGR